MQSNAWHCDSDADKEDLNRHNMSNRVWMNAEIIESLVQFSDSDNISRKKTQAASSSVSAEEKKIVP